MGTSWASLSPTIKPVPSETIFQSCFQGDRRWDGICRSEHYCGSCLVWNLMQSPSEPSGDLLLENQEPPGQHLQFSVTKRCRPIGATINSGARHGHNHACEMSIQGIVIPQRAQVISGLTWSGLIPSDMTDGLQRLRQGAGHRWPEHGPPASSSVPAPAQNSLVCEEP